MELQANVLMPSGMSANEGVLMYNTETKQLSYVKFLEQFSGRVNIISWIFIKLFRSARRTVQDDKIIFSISKDEILSLKYELFFHSRSRSELLLSLKSQIYHLLA